jgi:casein kinase 1
VLDCLERLHEAGFVHNDLKPENLLVGGRNLLDKIFMIDFGLSTRYVDDNNNHVEMECNVPYEGTLAFATRNAIMGVTRSRRDDIISLSYVLIYLLDSKIPWYWHYNEENAIEEKRKMKLYKINNNYNEFLTPKTV